MARAALQLDEEALYQKAVRALASRSRSEAEVRRLLLPRASQPALVDAVLARLRDHGYLNDARFAESFAGWKKETEKHGRLRALRELRRRGVAGEVAERAVAASYRGVSDERLARDFLKKKRIKRPETLNQAAGLVRKLMMAGFSPAVAQRALRQWRLDPEWLEALDQADMAAEQSGEE